MLVTSPTELNTSILALTQCRARIIFASHLTKWDALEPLVCCHVLSQAFG